MNAQSVRLSKDEGSEGWRARFCARSVPLTSADVSVVHVRRWSINNDFDVREREREKEKSVISSRDAFRSDSVASGRGESRTGTTTTTTAPEAPGLAAMVCRLCETRSARDTTTVGQIDICPYCIVTCYREQEVGEAACDGGRSHQETTATMDDDERRRQRQRHLRATLCVESDEVENSDESSESRPAGERWAPVGANDGDNEFADEYKYVNANVDKYVDPSTNPNSLVSFFPSRNLRYGIPPITYAATFEP